MSSIIIDRRKNAKGRSTVNRQRYVRRVREQVREAVKDVIRDGNIKDVIDEKGKKVRIPGKGLSQPTFHHGASGGITDRVYPGNKDFVQGDRVDRPQKGGGQGGGQGDASPDGEGEDGFEFHLTRDEFLDIFFEDLELPDLIKKQITKIDEYVYRRAGYSVDGTPARLNIVRSMKQSRSRRIALKGPKRKKVKEYQQELDALLLLPSLTDEQKQRVQWLQEEIAKAKKRIRAVPFIDDVDLRYNRWEKCPLPSTQAVMFCLMDVSASMGDWEKEMAKRFFMLLYLFLMKNYQRVEIEFIRHTQVAKVVNEEEFFYSRETGGTLVSSGLELIDQVIKQKYPPTEWNIFTCQASDGDNWRNDSIECQDILRNKILPITQYFAYIETTNNGNTRTSDLWPYYEQIAQGHSNFQMRKITNPADIYPVFRGLFEKREK